jgi:hypothetical protein
MLELSAQIGAGLQNSALAHPQAVARTPGTPTKNLRSDRLNDEFRSRRKVEAFLSDISFSSNNVVLFDEFLELRDIFWRGACGSRRHSHPISDLGVCRLAVRRPGRFGGMASIAGDRGGQGDSENEFEQSRAHAMNTSSSQAGPQNAHLRL